MFIGVRYFRAWGFRLTAVYNSVFVHRACSGSALEYLWLFASWVVHGLLVLRLLGCLGFWIRAQGGLGFLGFKVWGLGLFGVHRLRLFGLQVARGSAVHSGGHLIHDVPQFPQHYLHIYTSMDCCTSLKL